MTTERVKREGGWHDTSPVPVAFSRALEHFVNNRDVGRDADSMCTDIKDGQRSRPRNMPS
jgi:hypothetical protein